jgi:hypothetical protein
MISTPSSPSSADVKTVTDALFNQLMSVMGFNRTSWITRCLNPIFRPPAANLSQRLVDLDREIAQSGFTQGLKQFLCDFVTDVQISGAAAIPDQGPLMVVGNHPAAFDVIILAALIHREDLKVIASDIAIVQLLPNIAMHSIPVPYNIPNRLQTVRTSISHLKNNGAVFVFPRGNVEPDPTVSPGAEESLSGWSPSIELFLRKVPQTRTVVAITSGMLSGKWFNNPLVKSWKKYEQRQKVAEIFQIASQIITRRRPSINPKVTFSAPLSVEELGGENSPPGILLDGIIEEALQLFKAHPHT